MDIAAIVLIILAAGMASQWISWRLRLPAIVLLIAAGLLLGPVTGLIQIEIEHEALSHLIGLGVAIILFEGGMALRLNELKHSGRGIGRLVMLGAPLSFILGSTAAHYIGGLSWPTACVIGAILVVTGPTVIQPILEHARLNRQSGALLRWEGIVNDPLGVLMAVLAYQYFIYTGEGLDATALALGAAVLIALLAGGAGGWLIGKVFQRGWVPEHLKAPILMVCVLLVYALSNLVQKEAGLLSVTLMGLVLGNMDLGEREELQRFKEHLTVILISVLFLVITSQLEIEQLAMIDWRIAALVLAFLLLVRPLAIGLATLGSDIPRNDRLLLGWIAPRGIVAAVTAGLFGPGLVEAGYADAALVVPVVFAVIIVTVVLHSLTLAPMARRLELAAEDDNGLLIVGASDWTLALASQLSRLNVSVLLIDGVYQKLRKVRMAGIETYHGEILSEHAEDMLETQHLDHLLCATENDFYNALVCKAEGHHFGQHRTLQLATHAESANENRQVTRQQRGDIAIHEQADFYDLQQKLNAGWVFQHTTLTDEFGEDELAAVIGQTRDELYLVAAVTPDGQLRMNSEQQRISPRQGWTVIYFAPES